MSNLNLSLTATQRVELENLGADADQPAVRRRAQIILLLHAGYTSTHLAGELGVSRKTIYNVARKFELFGIDGIYDRPRTGRPGKVDEHYCALLEETLAHDPAEFGYPTLGWTTKLIQQHMREKTGVSLSLSSLNTLLHNLGYAFQRQGPRVDALLPPMPDHLPQIDRWLSMRDALKKTQPRRMFRPYYSWAKPNRVRGAAKGPRRKGG
jgi:transposase